MGAPFRTMIFSLEIDALADQKRVVIWTKQFECAPRSDTVMSAFGTVFSRGIAGGQKRKSQVYGRAQ
jgi:hypothetical protein